MSRRAIWVYLYVVGVAVAAALLLRESLVHWPLAESELLPVALFAVFMLVIELFEVRTAIGVRWNASATVDLAIWIIFGPAWVMLVELFAVPIGDGVVKRQPPIKVIFNACSSALAAGAACVTCRLMPGSVSPTTPLFLLAAVVSLFVFSALNHLITGMVIAISSGQRIRDVLGEVFGWHFLTGQASTPLAAFFVFAYEFAGLWSLILFGIPLYMVYQAHRLFPVGDYTEADWRRHIWGYYRLIERVALFRHGLIARLLAEELTPPQRQAEIEQRQAELDARLLAAQQAAAQHGPSIYTRGGNLMSQMPFIVFVQQITLLK